jgi:hypothetical protein
VNKIRGLDLTARETFWFRAAANLRIGYRYMSDETPPPPLRLKPRQRPETEAPAAAPAPAAPAAPVVPAVEAEDGKLRLKPKLIGEVPGSGSRPPSVAPLGTNPGTSSTASDRIRLKPKLSMSAPPPATRAPMEPPPGSQTVELFPAPSPTQGEGRIKFKIRLPSAEGSNPPSDSTPPVPPAATEAAEPPQLPAFPQVVPPPPDDDEIVDPAAAPPPPPPEASRPPLTGRPRVPSALVAAERRKKMIKYGMVALWGVILAAAVIFGAYLKFAEPPERVRVPPRVHKLPPLAPTVVTPVPATTETPSKATTPVPVDPASGTRVASTASFELAPGVKATTESVKAVRNASPEFRAFVAGARISGVYQGTPPRAFINGRMMRTGEVVDSFLEITFDSVDPDTKSIVFKDSSGATVSRRY